MYRKATIKIDIDRLRDDMRDECLGAYYGGGFGGALNESFDIDCVLLCQDLVQIKMRNFTSQLTTYSCSFSKSSGGI